jgi:hypothetical protein
MRPDLMGQLRRLTWRKEGREACPMASSPPASGHVVWGRSCPCSGRLAVSQSEATMLSSTGHGRQRMPSSLFRWIITRKACMAQSWHAQFHRRYSLETGLVMAPGGILYAIHSCPSVVLHIGPNLALADQKLASQNPVPASDSPTQCCDLICYMTSCTVANWASHQGFPNNGTVHAPINTLHI